MPDGQTIPSKKKRLSASERLSPKKADIQSKWKR
jgi:hypothetical protein